MPNAEEIQRVAAAMHAVRPDWPTGSLCTFLAKNHSATAFRDLLVAGVWVASDTRTSTPRLLLEHGPWWQAAQAGFAEQGGHSDHRFARCQVLGHGSYPADNCGPCRFESLDPGEPQPRPGSDRYAEAAAKGAAAAREAIRAGRESGQCQDDEEVVAA